MYPAQLLHRRTSYICCLLCTLQETQLALISRKKNWKLNTTGRAGWRFCLPASHASILPPPPSFVYSKKYASTRSHGVLVRFALGRVGGVSDERSVSGLHFPGSLCSGESPEISAVPVTRLGELPPAVVIWTADGEPYMATSTLLAASPSIFNLKGQL